MNVVARYVRQRYVDTTTNRRHKGPLLTSSDDPIADKQLFLISMFRSIRKCRSKSVGVFLEIVESWILISCVCVGFKMAVRHCRGESRQQCNGDVRRQTFGNIYVLDSSSFLFGCVCVWKNACNVFIKLKLINHGKTWVFFSLSRSLV